MLISFWDLRWLFIDQPQFIEYLIMEAPTINEILVFYFQNLSSRLQKDAICQIMRRRLCQQETLKQCIELTIAMFITLAIKSRTIRCIFNGRKAMLEIIAACLGYIDILQRRLLQMQQHNDFYMYSHSSRFTSTLTGQPQYGDRFSRPFEMNTSAQHRQFHQMKAEMPSDVLELFKANDVAFLKAPGKPKCRPLDPVTTTCKDINSMFDIPNENWEEKEKRQTKDEKKQRIIFERKERNEGRVRNEIEEWNPFEDEKAASDPEKTLLVGRLSHKTTEKSLSFEFEKYGIIKSVRIVRDLEGKSRGYGFVEFDSKEDFIAAYKSANYRKIDGAKIIVDFERGRTLLNWRPRRFGGGRGHLRMTREEVEEVDRLEREKRKEKERERERSRSHKHRKSRERGDKKDKKEKKQKKDKRQRRDRYDD